MKEEDIRSLTYLTESLRNYAQTPGIFNGPIGDLMLIALRTELSNVEIIRENHPSQWDYYCVANKALVMLNAGRPFLNPIALGQIIAVLEMVISDERKPGGWQCIHPQIQKSSKQLYLDGHYTNAAEDAFIELNDRAKSIYARMKPGNPAIPDGVDVMNQLFGVDALIKLADTRTKTGKSVQEGFRSLFAGAISALRNEKAHTNTVKISAAESMRRLMFASMLMYKLDEAEGFKTVESDKTVT